MIRSQLNSYSGADPIWGFVALIASERYTGEAAVGIDPRVRLFAVDGRVYLAEREGDAPIGTRLLSSGLVSTTQLEGGAVQICETTSLARLFQRQPSIDRDAVELTIELASESLLESVANKAVGMPEVFPLRHHSSGVHHWLRAAATSVPPPVAEPAVQPPGEEAIIAEPVIEEPVIAEPVIEEPVIEETIVAEAIVIEEPVIEEAVVEEPVIEEPVIEEAVVEEPVIEEAIAEEAVIEEAIAEEAVIEEAVIAEEAVIEEAVIEEAIIEEAIIEEAIIEEAIIEEAIIEEATVKLVAEAAPVEEPMPLPLPTLASLTLPTLQSTPAHQPLALPNSFPQFTPVPESAQDFFASLPERPTLASAHSYTPAEPLAELPKLATIHIATNDGTAGTPAPTTSFGEPTHNLAAVDIWEMVDVLTVDGDHNEQELVGSGGSEKRGRSWLRGKKG